MSLCPIMVRPGLPEGPTALPWQDCDEPSSGILSCRHVSLASFSVVTQKPSPVSQSRGSALGREGQTLGGWGDDINPHFSGANLYLKQTVNKAGFFILILQEWKLRLKEARPLAQEPHS